MWQAAASWTPCARSPGGRVGGSTGRRMSASPKAGWSCTAARGSDAWRTTSYGFVRDSAHALLSDLPDGWAVAGVVPRRFRPAVRPGRNHGADRRNPLDQGRCRVLRRCGFRRRRWSPTACRTGRSAPVPRLGGQRGHGAGQPLRDGADDANQDAPTTRGGCCGWRRSTRPPSPIAGPYCCAPERDGLDGHLHPLGGRAGRHGPARRLRFLSEDDPNDAEQHDTEPCWTWRSAAPGPPGPN